MQSLKQQKEEDVGTSLFHHFMAQRRLLKPEDEMVGKIYWVGRAETTLVKNQVQGYDQNDDLLMCSFVLCVKVSKYVGLSWHD